MLAAAGHRAADGRTFSMVPTSAGAVDLPALMAQKLVDRLRRATYVADAHGFPVRDGHARFVDEVTLQVDGERFVAPGYVVATGAAPHVAPRGHRTAFASLLPALSTGPAAVGSDRAGRRSVTLHSCRW